MKKKQVDELKKKVDEIENNWKRALADYQNLQKQVAKDKQKWVDWASRDLVLKILPTLEGLQKAVREIKDQGLDLIYKELKRALQDEGLEKIETKDKIFNPEEMECVEVVAGKSENQVAEEASPGYKLKGRILKVAKVKVYKEKVKN